MAEAKHYCADCDTHYGGPPNYINPEEHGDIAHGGGVFRGVSNGDYRDYERNTGDL